MKKFVLCALLASCSLVQVGKSRADNVFHIGHSLMEKEMPFFVKTLADEAKVPHSYDYQLLIGAPLQHQWNIDNPGGQGQSAKWRQGKPARASIATGQYDAVIMCDATPVLEHLKWGSLDYAPKFYDLAMSKNPRARVFMYHFWPHLNAPNYKAAFAEELAAYEKIADTATALHADKYPGKRMHVIPAGAAIVELKDRIERGQVPGIRSIKEIYKDDIHLTHTGMYMVALVHFASLYHRNPAGLSATMKNQWGQEIVNLAPATAAVFQEIAWNTVRNYPRVGAKVGAEEG